jgi:hypothetical protein
MKIAKALKLKNRLAGEIARLKSIAQSKNVTEVTQQPVYDVKKIIKVDLPACIASLISVKTVIAISNAGVRPNSATWSEDSDVNFRSIFSMAEMKGMIETLRAMDTKDGTYNEAKGRFGELATANAVTYVAALKQTEVDELVAFYERSIDALQDTIDAHNATSEWSILDGYTI